LTDEREKTFDTLPPKAKGEIVREFGRVSGELAALHARCARLDTVLRERTREVRKLERLTEELRAELGEHAEETGRHQTERLSKELAKYEDDDKWRRRTVIAALVTIAVAAIIAAAKMVF